MRDEFKEYGEEKLDSIHDKARDWFHGRRVLVVVDNVFAASDGSAPGRWIAYFKNALGPDCCLLFSTRESALTVSSDAHIPFEPLDALQKQRELFHAHLGTTGRSLERDQVERLLRCCHGLPIALATVAALVRLLDFEWSLIERRLDESIWEPSNRASAALPRL
jgi:hypothetical protein